MFRAVEGASCVWHMVLLEGAAYICCNNILRQGLLPTFFLAHVLLEGLHCREGTFFCRVNDLSDPVPKKINGIVRLDHRILTKKANHDDLILRAPSRKRKNV